MTKRTRNVPSVDTDRRQFLSLAGGAGLMLAGGAAALPARADAVQWDMVTDMVCVGSGAAACAAAVTATGLGNEVVMLEKLPIIGGTTRRSGGVAWIPNNFSLRAAGIDDSEQDCLAYMCRYAYPERYQAGHPTLGLSEREYALLQAFYRNGSKMIDEFQASGASDFIRFELPGFGPSPDYSPRLPENRTPRGRALWPDPSVNGGRGAAMVDKMAAWVSERGGKVLTSHRVTALIHDDERVLGVEVEHNGKTLRLRARKGVIFGSGGFAHNPAMTQRYQTMLYGACAAPGSEGDFVRMAGSVGARLGAMHTAWRSQVVLEAALRSHVLGTAVNIPGGDSMIIVNKYGQRVVNEKRNYNDRTTVHFQWDPSAVEYRNQFLFMVFDQRALDVYGGNYPLPNDPREVNYLIQADTLEALGGAIQARLDSLQEKIGQVTLKDSFGDQLKDTVKRFNRYAKRGVDDEFGRGSDPAETDWLAYFSRPKAGREDEAKKMPSPTMHPFAARGPFYAIVLAAGALDTSAGPEINAEAQVLNEQGEPIAGLYGAGNCIASPSRDAYFGAGGTIGPALTFGYIAAQAAHRQGG